LSQNPGFTGGQEVTIIAVMPQPTPLVTLLSQAFVAYTIEFDNEGGHRLPHRSSSHGGERDVPWLVSMAMWFNCLQFLDEQGITVTELFHRARARTNLHGMRRWGCIKLTANPVPGKTKGSKWIVRPTPAGLAVQKIWRPIFNTMESRWEDRFGKPEVKQLQQSMAKIEKQFDIYLPDCLPILGYGLTSSGHRYGPKAAKERIDRELQIPVLLARILLAFAIAFEKKSELSLAMSANVVRVLGRKGLRLRDIPQLSGVSKAAVAMALSYLTKRGFTAIEKDPSAARGKIIRLTRKGLDPQNHYHARIGEIETAWKTRFGKSAMSELREAVQAIVEEAKAGPSPLFLGLEPYPDNWPSSLPKLQVLPHLPMVLHRGGYPDGS
jgi:DNA-binding MarR family transcriptional regulator